VVIQLTVHPSTATWLRERIDDLHCLPQSDRRVILMLEPWQATAALSWLSELADHWRAKYETETSWSAAR
jgi:hypothetical protein